MGLVIVVGKCSNKEDGTRSVPTTLHRGLKSRLQVDCDTFNLDNENDRLLYCLWGLTDNEIAVVKGMNLGFTLEKCFWRKLQVGLDVRLRDMVEI